LRNHPQFKAYVALAAVCFFWGTTYLGIRMALESFPPLLLISVRFLISGSLLLIGALAVRTHLPKGRELWRTAINGILVLGVGNGCLTFSELWIPSGLAALFITVSPFWMVGMEALLPGGDRLYAPTVAGMVVGLLGAALLVAPGVMETGWEGNTMRGFLVLQLGCAAWALGSIIQRRQVQRAHPVVSGALQQLAAGLAFLPLAIAVPEHSIHWSSRGVGAMLYLIVFGSVVGYSAYIYVLGKLPVPVVSIYNYVNPAVAVTLGWLVYREPFGRRELAAMLIIFLGVALVKRFTPGRVSRPTNAHELIGSDLEKR
jgi:drug/metabolite transporter (DMT)-like permease